MWKGEELFSGIFGFRGLKCICILIMFALNQIIDMINELRALHGLTQKTKWTWQQVLNKVETLMEEHKADDEGIEEL